jgi:membrane protease YdiL (CAAX protease family)
MSGAVVVPRGGSFGGDHRSLLLSIGFAASVGMRLLVGGPGVSRSPVAGVVFAACLLALATAARTRVSCSRTAVLLGLSGAVLLCIPVAVGRLDRPLHSGAGFTGWAAVVSIVAVSEELFLRGALYDAVCAASGPTSAITVSAAAFALLHVPLYGWHCVPVDLYVGCVLGELRRRAGTPLAPAITHVGADLAAWFLR